MGTVPKWHVWPVDRTGRLKYFVQIPACQNAERRTNMDQILDTLEPVILGAADELTEFGWNGGDDNSRSDFWWWF